MENFTRPRKEDVHIHFFRFEKNPDFYSLPDLLSFLPPEENDQYDSLKNEGRRREFLWSRILLRSLLSGYLNQTLKSFQLKYQAKGKPFIEKADLHFNLSHSEDLIACSFARVEVGIDIEKMQDAEKVRERYELLAKRYFSPEERAYLYDQSAASWSSTFLRIFTLKEAYAKSLGRGLSLSFDQFTVPLPLKESAHLGFREYFSEIDPVHNFCLAHVADSPEGIIYRHKICRWNEESLIHFVRGFIKKVE